MTRPDDWEAVGRETLYYVLVSLASEIERSVEPVADTVYWGHEPDAEQVARLRRLAFEFEYAVEAYVAALAAGTEPWSGDGGPPPGPPDGDGRAPANDPTDDADDAPPDSPAADTSTDDHPPAEDPSTDDDSPAAGSPTDDADGTP